MSRAKGRELEDERQPAFWLLLAAPAAVEAQFNYTVTNGTVIITGYTGTNNVVEVPGSIDGLPVTSIGMSAFYYCTNLTSVIIPNSISGIGLDAFAGCASLISVTIPNSVIGHGHNDNDRDGVTLF